MVQYIGENGKFLTAENGGGLNGDPERVNGQPGAPTEAEADVLVCDRTQEDLDTYGSSWQDFVEVANGDGTVSLQIGPWFVTAERGGGHMISTDRMTNELWQRFRKRDVGGQSLFCASDGVHYLRVREDETVDCRGVLPAGLSFTSLKPTQGDPDAWTDEQLLAIRGSLNIRVQCAWGPRPGQPNNMGSTNGFWHYTTEDQDRILQAYLDRGYTHGPIGPFVDGGYHGQIPGIDILHNPADEERVQACIEKIAAAGIIPVLFIQVDGWSIDQMDQFRPIFAKDWWQRWGRIVCNGFEQQGDKYGWSNQMYVDWLSWLQSVFPNAKRLLHTVSDIEAPVGAGDDTSQPGMSNGECWGRVTPLVHGWLFQSNALFPAGCQGAQGPSYIADNGKSNEQNWYECFDASYPYSFTSRFRDGYAGWPQGSANGPASPMKVYAGEFYSYPLWWIESTEEGFAQDHGQRAVQLGAAGSFDGWRP